MNYKSKSSNSCNSRIAKKTSKVFENHSIKVKRNELSKKFYNGHLEKIMRSPEMRVTKRFFLMGWVIFVYVLILSS